MASTKSQRNATRTHRRRAAARGLVRVEVQTPKRDARLIRAVAETLRGRAQEANALRAKNDLRESTTQRARLRKSCHPCCRPQGA